MKKYYYIYVLIFSTFFLKSNAQNTYPFPASGSVGIGTASPIGLFQLGSSPSSRIIFNSGWLQEFGTTGGSGISYNIYYSGNYKYRNSSFGGAHLNLSGGNFNFSTAPVGIADSVSLLTSRLFIGNNGKIGIGTVTPTSTLQVSGDLMVDNIRIHRNNLASNLYFGGNGTGGGSGLYNVGIGDYVMLSTSGGDNVAVGRASGQNISTGSGNSFFGRATGTLTTTGVNNVGIGVNSLTTNTIGSNNVAIGTNSMQYSKVASRNIGIGYYAGAYWGGGTTEVNGYNVAIGWESQASSASNSINTIGYHNISFGYRSLFSNTKGLYNFSGVHSSLLNNLEGSYNTAIGYLALSSNINKSNNIAIGTEAMRHFNGDSTLASTYNIALGANALRGNTTNTSLNRGVQNIAIGVNSLLNNESGGNNIAINNAALSNNKTGSNNIAIGYAALLSAKALNYNIGIGYEAMRYTNDTTLSTTPFNIAIGFYALRGNSTKPALNTGTSNTAIGGYSLTNNTTGTGNTVVGYNSMPANISGSYNSTFGQSSLSSNTTASYNVAVGLQAGQFSNSHYNVYLGVTSGVGIVSSLNTGGYNTAIGHDALRNIRGTGQQNVAVGQASANTITTGNQNTIIGRNTGIGIKQGSGNTILGYGVTGLDSTMSNNLILATGTGVKLRALENGNVGIGTNTPKAKLDVNGSVAIGFESTLNYPSSYKLAIDGNVIAEKVKVKNSTAWPDFVFDEEYKLKSLDETEEFIKKNKHLPEVPSSQEVEENGIDLGNMDAILLKKLEEITLHLIALKKENDALKDKVKELELKVK
ncbi:MAG: hypothetical protein LCH67_08290 [Bacteroidetes bacterium]|nr:hypothetical protein [Bacteroidota bacterium]